MFARQNNPALPLILLVTRRTAQLIQDERLCVFVDRKQEILTFRKLLKAYLAFNRRFRAYPVPLRICAPDLCTCSRQLGQCITAHLLRRLGIRQLLQDAEDLAEVGHLVQDVLLILKHLLLVLQLLYLVELVCHVLNDVLLLGVHGFDSSAQVEYFLRILIRNLNRILNFIFHTDKSKMLFLFIFVDRPLNFLLHLHMHFEHFAVSHHQIEVLFLQLLHLCFQLLILNF